MTSSEMQYKLGAIELILFTYHYLTSNISSLLLYFINILLILIEVDKQIGAGVVEMSENISVGLKDVIRIKKKTRELGKHRKY